MTDKQRTGRWGEKLAAELLESKGYRIAARNYRYRRNEIDLIAWHEELLVFVEVKTRAANSVRSATGALSKAQQNRISKTAAVYMEEIDYDWEIRFDLVAVTDNGELPPRIEHLEDVFFPGLF